MTQINNRDNDADNIHTKKTQNKCKTEDNPTYKRQKNKFKE